MPLSLEPGSFRQLGLPNPEGVRRVGLDPSEPPTVWPGPGRYRFDDPQRQYAVLYVAASLRGALLETMEPRLRQVSRALELMAAVQNASPQDGEADTDHTQGVEAWLGENKQAVLHVTVVDPLIDINDQSLLSALDDDAGVSTALAEATDLVEAGAPPARLDQGIIRMSGPTGRRITQAVSRAAFTGFSPSIAGLAYRSRLGDEEVCWAIWSVSGVVAASVTSLSPEDPEHRLAVQQAAATLGIPLPESWS
jgi:hypothetical protein